MRFPMPHYPCDFEIPDDWLLEAGMVGFTPTEGAFHSEAPALFVPLTTIEPIPRFISHPKDWRGFDRARMIRLFKGFVSRDEIEPVPLFELPVSEFAHSPYRYRVLNGLHRFYGSIAAGYPCLPAVI
jgi:hypothetical protein